MEKLNKQDLFEIGVNYITKFCEINNIKMPKIVVKDKNSFFPATCGFYSNKTIYISIHKCAQEVNKPGFRNWSHRHYFTDREPCGVVCHEFGHYLHDILTNEKLVLPVEKRITSYEPNFNERFAETIKLFITNPDLLKQYDPKRYNVLTKKLNLKPIFNESWETIMRKANMDEKFINAAKNKIGS